MQFHVFHTVDHTIYSKFKFIISHWFAILGHHTARNQARCPASYHCTARRNVDIMQKLTTDYSPFSVQCNKISPADQSWYEV